MSRFEETFRRAQQAMGLHHYRVTFEAVPLEPEYADIAPDPSRCFAHCRYDPDWLAKAGATDLVAVHEACHLLLADLVHACAQSDRIAAIEEERTVMRIERLVLAAVGAGSGKAVSS